MIWPLRVSCSLGPTAASPAEITAFADTHSVASKCWQELGNLRTRQRKLCSLMLDNTAAVRDLWPSQDTHRCLAGLRTSSRATASCSDADPSYVNCQDYSHMPSSARHDGMLEDTVHGADDGGLTWEVQLIKQYSSPRGLRICLVWPSAWQHTSFRWMFTLQGA